ncbi:unnamed protein product [Cyprideis torosa]|uniref:Uncharacterized protein n=1 Tax=Cyprideis torosa TaxID=163714 RepID=A0A7R8W8E8_9CRUS|nr:unnamed protein product [Cyprideis torosa]CAG0884235.1 unnamed protein product [Cyprideis torosa]
MCHFLLPMSWRLGLVYQVADENRRSPMQWSWFLGSSNWGANWGTISSFFRDHDSKVLMGCCWAFPTTGLLFYQSRASRPSLGFLDTALRSSLQYERYKGLYGQPPSVYAFPKRGRANSVFAPSSHGTPMHRLMAGFRNPIMERDSFESSTENSGDDGPHKKVVRRSRSEDNLRSTPVKKSSIGSLKKLQTQRCESSALLPEVHTSRTPSICPLRSPLGMRSPSNPPSNATTSSSLLFSPFSLRAVCRTTAHHHTPLLDEDLPSALRRFSAMSSITSGGSNSSVASSSGSVHAIVHHSPLPLEEAIPEAQEIKEEDDEDEDGPQDCETDALLPSASSKPECLHRSESFRIGMADESCLLDCDSPTTTPTVTFKSTAV